MTIIVRSSLARRSLPDPPGVINKRNQTKVINAGQIYESFSYCTPPIFHQYHSDFQNCLTVNLRYDQNTQCIAHLKIIWASKSSYFQKNPFTINYSTFKIFILVFIQVKCSQCKSVQFTSRKLNICLG